jgi:hypothetical protein
MQLTAAAGCSRLWQTHRQLQYKHSQIEQEWQQDEEEGQEEIEPEEEDPGRLLLMRAWRAWRSSVLSARFMMSWTGAAAEHCLGCRCVAGWRQVAAGRRRRRLLG